MINGADNEDIEIEWVKIKQIRREGYLREDFTIASGKTIWRAMADIGGAPSHLTYGANEIHTNFYINGTEVVRNGKRQIHQTDPVDISSYLSVGNNCAAFYGYRVNGGIYSPLVYLQCKIVYTDGTTQDLTHASGWKSLASSSSPPSGWNEYGFDDSGWDTPDTGRPIETTLRSDAEEVPLAVYGGLLDLKNPDANTTQLFYEEGEEVIIDVYVPSGLSDDNPSLTYYYGAANSDGETPSTSNSTTTSYTTVGSSLKFSINLGDALAHGVYTIALSLDCDGTAYDATRQREPFVVMAKHDPSPIEGTSYDQGITKTLEDTINFYDDEDTHANKEYVNNGSSNATEVSSGNFVYKTLPDGTSYREVSDDGRGSFFTYRFTLAHPGDFYMAELEYPDDGDRLIEVSISNKIEGIWSPTVSGVGAETGRKFPNGYDMKTLRWVFVAGHPDATIHSIDILNGENGIKSAARSLKIYHITSDLPAIRMGSNRTFGIHSERCFYDSGIGTNFGSPRWASDSAKSTYESSHTLMARYIKDMVWMEATSNNYIQYMKFCGQNMHIMGGYQYSESNTPAVLSNTVGDSHIVHCFRNFLAHAFELNDIDFYIGMEFSRYMGADNALYNDAQVANGAETSFMVDYNGKQNNDTYYVSAVANWMHPDSQEYFLKYIKSWASLYGEHSHFKGVHITSGVAAHPIGYWGTGVVDIDQTQNPPEGDYSDPLGFSFDDYTFDTFETDTGNDLGISASATDRFEQRLEALLDDNDLRQEFLDWRAGKFQEFMEDIIDEMQDEVATVQLALEENQSNTWMLQYREGYDTEDQGTWVDVDADDPAWETNSTHTLSLSNNDEVTTGNYDMASPGSAYSVANGEFSDDADGVPDSYSEGDYVELWYAVTPQSGAEGHNYAFRLANATNEVSVVTFATASPYFEVEASGNCWAPDADVDADELNWLAEGQELDAEASTTYILACQIAMDEAVSSGDWSIQYQEDYLDDSPGSWTTITSSSTAWQADTAQLLGNPTDLSDGDAIATGDFANAAESGYSAAAGEFCNDGTVAGAAYSDADSTEIWYAIKPTASAEGNSYTFRIIKSGSTFSYDTYASASVAAASSGPTDYVLYLELDETSGSTAYDESANSNDGALVGNATWDASGHLNGCVTLDGSSDNVNCGSDASLEFGSAITVTAWVKTSSAATYQGIAGKLGGRSPAAGFAFFLSSGQCRLYLFNSGSNSWVYGPTDLDDGEWHFVCFYSSSTERGGWVDDTEYTTTAVAYLAESSYDFIIGDAVGDFNGEIDDVRVYDYVLTDAEVQAISGL